MSKNNKNLSKFIVTLRFGGKHMFVSNKKYFYLYVDKNGSVYDITRLEVLSWKTNKKKRKVPDQISEKRDRKLFDMLYGQPKAIVERKLEIICSFNEDNN